MLYLGQYERTLTKEGSLRLPADWRTGGKTYLAGYLGEDALRFMEVEESAGKIEELLEVWQEEEEFMPTWSIASREGGWITLPGEVLPHIDAPDHTICVIGIGKGFEVWNQQAWYIEEKRMEQEDIFQDIVASLE